MDIPCATPDMELASSKRNMARLFFNAYFRLRD